MWAGSRGFDARFLQKVQNPFLSVIGFILQKRLYRGKNAWQQRVGSFKIVRLPGDSMKRPGLPNASTAVWILVVRPPVPWPIASCVCCPLWHPRCADAPGQ